jgi:hypothetical protein
MRTKVLLFFKIAPSFVDETAQHKSTNQCGT